jgi:hypothetical protein
MDNAAYVTRMCSLLVEGVHMTFLDPHALGAWSWLVAWYTHNHLIISTVLKEATSWGDGSCTNCCTGHLRPCHALGNCNLPSYLIVNASLQNSKFYKVNEESKTQLVCHLSRLVQFLYGHIRVSSPIRFLKIWPYVMYYIHNALIPTLTSRPYLRAGCHNSSV